MTEIFKSIFITPLVGGLVFFPVFVFIFLLHKSKINGKVSTFRFHYANLILCGGLYQIYIVIISFSIQSSMAVMENVFILSVILIIHLLFLFSIPLWYKTGSRVLLALYFLYLIFLLNPFSFLYPYFYLVFLFSKFIWEKYRTSKKIKFLLFRLSNFNKVHRTSVYDILI